MVNHGPQQPYYAPQPGYPPPPAPPTNQPKKFGWGALILVGALCFLFGVGCGAMSGSPSTSSSNSSAPSAPTPAPAAGEDAPATAQTVEAAPEPEGPEAGTIPQGEWIVGDEVAPGRYRSAGAETGIFELCSVFVNDESGSVMDFSTGNEGEQVLITIPENAATVSNSGCVPFRPVG